MMKTYRIIGIGVLFLAVTVSAHASEKEPCTAGEQWIYEHEGPRPWSRGNVSVEGDRIREVLRTSKEKDRQYWVVRETWGTADDRPDYLYRDSEGAIFKRRVGDNFEIAYDPPVPDDLSGLKLDEEISLTVEISFGDRDPQPMKITAKRLEDETVEVPAGVFETCVHVALKAEFTFSRDGNTIAMVTDHDRWYHKSVNGFVKETYTVAPVRIGGNERPGYTCTSVLKEHKKKE